MPLAQTKKSSSPTKEQLHADNEKLEAYKMKIIKDAEILLCEKLPQRINELTELLKSSDFQRELTDCHSSVNIPRPDPKNVSQMPTEDGGDRKRKRVDDETNFSGTVSKLNGTKVMMLPNGSIELNKTISLLFAIVKPHIQRQIEDCCLLKLWIELLIPKVEDGNNFGVDIQEECLKIVSSTEADAIVYLDNPVRYYSARGKLLVQIAKYPFIEDYRRTVNELDEKQYLNLKLVLREICNSYASIHDVLMKNIEKIRRPRTTNALSLY